MNERIKELARKAGISILYEYDGYDGHAGAANFDDIEKFAELIVEECIAQCWAVSELESNGYVVSECSKKIRKHFGVEE
jgi:hypothetical protein